MATVTGFTAERMLEIENGTVVDGDVVGDDLVLRKRDGSTIDAGNVRGPVGPEGIKGDAFIVCTSGTRPVLGSADEGKAIFEKDTDLVKIWTGSRWRVQEKIVCTSTARPTLVSGDEGVEIYELDTNMRYLWTGTLWVPLARWSDIPAGCLASKTLTSSAGFNGLWYDISGGGSAVYVGSNRRIHVVVNVGFFIAAHDTGEIGVRVERFGNSLGESNQRLNIDRAYFSFTVEEMITTADVYTWSVSARAIGSGVDVPVDVNWVRKVYIYDMGPIVPILPPGGY